MADIPVNESTAETLVTVSYNGQTEVNFDFLVFTPEQLRVIIRPDGGGAEVELNYPADFSVSGLNNPMGGQITLIGVSTSVNDEIYLWRDTPIQREKDWQTAGDYKAELVNREQDEIYMILQENRRDLRSNAGGLNAEIAARVAGDEALSDRIDDMEGVVNDAADRAEAAAFASEGSANSSNDAADRAEAAAASVDGVFALENKTVLEALNVKPEVHAIHLDGWDALGDGRGGLFIDQDNGSTDTIVSGDGRTWYKVVDVQAQRVLHTPKINRLIPRSMQAIADGLPLSPAMFGAKGWDEATDGNAIRDALLFMAEFVHESDATLDLMGKRYLIDKPIHPTGAAFYRKRITNGLLRAAPTFPLDEHMFDFTGFDGGSRLTRNRFDNLNFIGSPPGSAIPRVGGWIRFNQTLGNEIHDCLFEFCRWRGVWDENTSAGAGNVIFNNRFYGGDQQDTFNTAVRLAGYDNKITNNMSAEFANHIFCEKGANIITGNHVYNYNTSATRGAGITTGPMENSNETIIQGNYVDTVRIDVFNPGNTSILGNKFLIPNISYWSERPETAFIELVSTETTGSVSVYGLLITGNQFKSSFGLAESVKGRTAGAALYLRNDAFIKDNIFKNVTKRAAQVSKTVSGLSSVSSVIIDLTEYKMPSIGSDFENAVSCIAQGSGGYISGVSRSSSIFTVLFSTPFTGKVTLSATMCANGAW